MSHLLLHLDALVLGHVARQREVAEVAADADAHGGGGEAELADVQDAVLGEAGDASEVPVVDVLGVLRHAVVVGQHLLKEGLELVVVLLLSSAKEHVSVVSVVGCGRSR